MDLVRARYNMVEQQIRTWEVLDQRVLETMANLPRDEFVPLSYRSLAYADLNLPLGHGQAMMEPKVEARMLQSLNISPHDTVLEVGTGSGYVTALLTRLGHHVYSVDIYPEFIVEAQHKLALHGGLDRVTLENGDATHGWTKHAPYDVIAITGSVPNLPDGFRTNLKVGGRLFAIVGQEPVMQALLVTRASEQGWTQEVLFETALPPLVNAIQPQRFVF